MPDCMKHKLDSRLPGEISNNLRYADDSTLMAESKEELKSLLMNVKGRVKLGYIQSHHFMANRWGKNGNSDRLYFFGLPNHCRW